LPMQQWLRRFEEVRRAHRAGDFVRSACPHNFRTPHTRHVCCRARRGGAQACTAPGAAHRRRHLSNAVARRGFPGLNWLWCKWCTSVGEAGMLTPVRIGNGRVEERGRAVRRSTLRP
jgi:hypothetical protein